MAFDFSTNIQAPDFEGAVRAHGGGLGKGISGLVQGAQAFMQNREKAKKQKIMFDQLSQIPELAHLAGPISQNPELLGQLGPALLKPQKPQMAWKPMSGMLSAGGRPLEIEETTGEVKEAGPQSKSTGYAASMAPIRQAQYTMQDLPSNQGPNTSGGAAYQVKVAARQGKSIIAKAGSAQRTGLGSADLARAILRAAPTEETLHNANFSDNTVTRFSRLKQKITADPNSVNNPLIRKEMYSIFDELDKAAEPWIKNQLDEMKDQGFPISKNTYRRQLGLDIPDIPFIELPGGQPTSSPAPGQGGWSIQRVQ